MSFAKYRASQTIRYKYWVD